MISSPVKGEPVAHKPCGNIFAARDADCDKAAIHRPRLRKSQLDVRSNPRVGERRQHRTGNAGHPIGYNADQIPEHRYPIGEHAGREFRAEFPSMTEAWPEIRSDAELDW